MVCLKETTTVYFSQGCNNRNLTSATSGTGTAYPFRAHGFIPGLYAVRAAQSLVFCIVICRSLFVPFF
jgi:hypothetical protein